MALFAKKKPVGDASEKKSLGRGVFRRCEGCAETLKAEEFTANLEDCPRCGHHYRLSAEAWVQYLIDPGSWTEHDEGLRSLDPLHFVDSQPYPERLSSSIKKSGVNDAFMAGSGTMGGRPVQLGCFVFRFMGGSMGSVVGEKITRMMERGAEQKQPVILLSASGGARMARASATGRTCR